jgi:hypothetical protein
VPFTARRDGRARSRAGQEKELLMNRVDRMAWSAFLVILVLAVVIGVYVGFVR